MKKLIAILLFGAALLLSRPAFAQVPFDLSNIQYWVGSGTNESALVITWNDGKTPDSLVWGYKWDDAVAGDPTTAPTGFDMLQAIAAADPRFHLFTLNFSFGPAVYGMGFDLTGNGGTFAPGTPGADEGGTFPADDHYAEGFFTAGFWGYMNGNGDPYDGGNWVDSELGASATLLTNDSWNGWSFSTDEVNFTVPHPTDEPTAVLAIPEPSNTALLSLGAAGMFAWWRRRRH